MTEDVKTDNVTLLLGDCLDRMKEIPDDSVDLILTDPPYGTTGCSWDTIIPFEMMWTEIRRILKKENSAVVFTASQPFTSALVMSNVEWFRHEWIWIKNRGSNFANTVREPMKEHESVLVFAEKKWTYNKQMQPRTGGGADRANYEVTFKTNSDNYRKFDTRENQKISEMRVPSSWQKFNTVSGKEKTKHPTQKPIMLMEYLIKTYTNKRDTVLDFTMGSGSTGVAAINLGRQFIGIEKDHEYFSVAKHRIVDVESQNTLSNFFGENE
jgi:site-specific DNA-methyltransferase (adenine-specific)